MRQVSARPERTAGGRRRPSAGDNPAERCGVRNSGIDLLYIPMAAETGGLLSSSNRGSVLLTPVVLLLQTAVALPPATAAGAVSGTVRDGTAQRPLADVAVTDAGEVAALSDSAGRYRLDRLAPGPH